MLTDLTCRAFTAAVAAGEPTPGGGSVAAYVGACGAALLEMVSRLSLSGRAHGGEFPGQLLALAAEKREELERLVDEDAAAFARVMQALKLPKETPAEKNKRKEALAEATLSASSVPLRTAAVCAELLEQIAEIIAEGNQNALSDAAVALECLYAACRGALYNVRINLRGLANPEEKETLLSGIKSVEERATKCYFKARELVGKKGL
ncbi:MAG: cyclodeaminase/cyclohydrolase family protein [Bacillota bacterium]